MKWLSCRYGRCVETILLLCLDSQLTLPYFVYKNAFLQGVPHFKCMIAAPFAFCTKLHSLRSYSRLGHAHVTEPWQFSVFSVRKTRGMNSRLPLASYRALTHMIENRMQWEPKTTVIHMNHNHWTSVTLYSIKLHKCVSPPKVQLFYKIISVELKFNSE